MDIDELKEKLKNLIDFNDLLNELHVKEFGEESPYKMSEETEAFFNKIINEGDENEES